MMNRSEAPEPAKPRILVVDDEPRSVELMARALRRLGVVETAESGEEAVKKLSTHIYHLVITDHRMPGMQGAELLARVAEQDERTGRVLITAYADMKATIDAINEGRLHAYVTKPWKPDQLSLIAKTLIERSDLARRNEALFRLAEKRNEELEIAMAEFRRLKSRLTADAEPSGAKLSIAPFAQHVLVQLEKAGKDRQEEEQVRLERLISTCDDVIALAAASGLTCSRHQGVDDVLRSALANLAGDADEAGVRFEGRFACVSSPPLDGARLQRALENIVRNAMEASPEGGSVRVDSWCEGGSVVIRVSDAGPGWPAAVRDQVFEPFVSYAKPNHCGVGLSLAKQVIEAHAGTAEALDGESGGAIVEIRIPIP
jgi:signal transduction histidine kinase